MVKAINLIYSSCVLKTYYIVRKFFLSAFNKSGKIESLLLETNFTFLVMIVQKTS